MICDGAPDHHDTLSVNSGGYLERHLREAIADIERRAAVELIATDIVHGVTRYDRRAVTVTDAEELSGTILAKLSELFAENAAPGRRSRLSRAA